MFNEKYITKTSLVKARKYAILRIFLGICDLLIALQNLFAITKEQREDIEAFIKSHIEE